MEQDKKRSKYLKLVILWLGIFLLGTFWMTVRTASEPISMSVMPQVPREGEPIIATFKLNNPSPNALPVGYQFYANGKLLKKGMTTIAPGSNQT